MADKRRSAQDLQVQIPTELRLFTIAFCVLFTLPLTGQVTLSGGNNALELTGIVNTYLNSTSSNGNSSYGFVLDDARLRLVGERHPSFSYRLEIDFAAINQDSLSEFVIVDAFVNIDLPKSWDAYIGFQQLPVSRNSSISRFNSVFSRRPPMSGGALYYRRSIGAYMRKKMVHDRLNMYAGAFSNRGALRNFSTNTAKLAYVARVDFSLPGRMREEEVDIRHTPVPLVGIGLNFIHTRHTREERVEMFPLEIQGRKIVGILDLALMYQGFSLQFEITNAWLKRDDDADPALPKEFNSGGFHTSINYFSKKWKSVFAARLEYFTPDDSAYDENFAAITLGYNYLVGQSHDFVVRADYRFFLNDDLSGTSYAENEVNVGLQYFF